MDGEEGQTGEIVKTYTYAEWFNIAQVTLNHYQFDRWFEPGLARKAALAATGLSEEDGIRTLVDAIEAGTRVAPNDDPHDGWVVKRLVATKFVPAPRSDPNPVLFSNPSNHFKRDFADLSDIYKPISGIDDL